MHLTSKDPLLYYAAPYSVLPFSQDDLPKSDDDCGSTLTAKVLYCDDLLLYLLPQIRPHIELLT